jgi:hypothetical protein
MIFFHGFKGTNAHCARRLRCAGNLLAPRPVALDAVYWSRIGEISIQALQDSPTYFGGFFDFLLIPNHSLLLFENVKQAVLTNSPQAYGGGDIFKTHSMMSVIRMELTIW